MTREKFISFEEWKTKKMKQNGIKISLALLDYAIQQGDLESAHIIIDDIIRGHGAATKKIIASRDKGHSIKLESKKR